MSALRTINNLDINKIVTLIVASAMCIAGAFMANNLILQSQTRLAAKELGRKEFGIWLFQKNYNNLPGNIPNATQLWSVNSFKKNCLYSSSGIAIDNRLIVRGFNGSGNGYVSALPVANNHSDPAIEASMVNCHLILSGIYKPNKQEPAIGRVINTPLGKPPKGVSQNKYFSILMLGSDSQTDKNNMAEAKNFLYITSPIFSKTSSPMQMTNTRLSGKVLMALDGKIDNGKPGRGFLKMHAKSNGSGAFRPCCSAVDSANGSCKPDSTYVNTRSKNSCYAQYSSRVL